MRVLITTLHVHPLVPIAQELEAAGHEVAWACSEDNRPAWEREPARVPLQRMMT